MISLSNPNFSEATQGATRDSKSGRVVEIGINSGSNA